MSNLRIIYDNAADRATITASSTAGLLGVQNLKNEIKGLPFRSVGNAVTLDLSWSNPEFFGGLFLPASNLTPDATCQIIGYSNSNFTGQLFDTGIRFANPGALTGQLDLGQPLNSNSTTNDGSLPLNANSFAYGGGAKCIQWADQQYIIKSLRVILADPLNSFNRIDISRLITGGYWSPQHNASYGAEITADDNSKITRTDSRDFIVDRNEIIDIMKFDIEGMPPEDRAVLTKIIKGVGTYRSISIFLIPDADDPLLQQDSSIYGKRDNSGMRFTSFNAYSNSFYIQGW